MSPSISDYQDLTEAVARFRGSEVIVWGDIILDEYIYTSSRRVSREAPVLITEYESNRLLPGGAGNVLMNVKALGGRPIPAGLIGDDETGGRILDILHEQGIDTRYLLKVPGGESPRKTRIMSGGEHTRKQQVLRIDRLNRRPLSPELYGELEGVLDRLLEDHELVLISDYLHRSVTAPVYRALRGKRPAGRFLVDSREHLNAFPGAFCFTPNEPEMRRLYPSREIRDSRDFLPLARELIREMNLQGLVLTRGQEGMTVFQESDSRVHEIPVHGSRSIVDVTGAGDTVISVIGLGILSGLSLPRAARLANVAAGVAVMHPGAYAISDRELFHALR